MFIASDVLSFADMLNTLRRLGICEQVVNLTLGLPETRKVNNCSKTWSAWPLKMQQSNLEVLRNSRQERFRDSLARRKLGSLLGLCDERDKSNGHFVF